MNAEKWNKIQSLFNEAIDLETSQRENFLKEHCGDDTTLYDEVQSLLNAEENPHKLLGDEKPDFSLESISHKDYINRLIGKTLGEYTVIEVIDSGGMGTVYRAQRSDGAFEQEVAIKVIHHSLISASFVERFRQERQILAKLNHPNIARLLDGGITEDGLPFFVMEIVSGKPLNAYIKANNLSIEKKLKLFLQICEAVKYAHSQLIVHRDLKPGNIFVTDNGEVKLLDFGIAKVFETEGNDFNVNTITNDEKAPFTPEYAAPEQINGETISIVTDVYALGVILYELLTGQRPYRFKSNLITEIQDVISNFIPSRPSTIVRQFETKTPNRYYMKKSINRLKGDLDNICLKALKKESSQRYENVEQLNKDINRHLAGLPVDASGDHVIYRARKFIQRHRFAVGLVSLFTVIIISIITMYTIMLKKQTDQALREAQKANEVSEFLGSLFEAASPEEARGKTITARDLLDQGANRIENELTDTPEIQAAMFGIIGDVYRRISDFEEAEILLDKALNRTKNIYGETSKETLIATSNLGELHMQKGQFDKSDSLLNNAIDMVDAVNDINPIKIGELMQIKAELVFEKGNIVSADSFYVISQRIYERELGTDHFLIADILNARASIARHNENYEESEKLYLQALDMRRKLFGDDHPDVAHSLNHLGRLMYQMERYPEAEDYARKGLALRQKIFGKNSPETGASMSNLAHILIKMNRYEEAVNYYQQVMEIMNDVYKEDHPYKAVTASNLGIILYRMGRLKQAELYLQSGYKQLNKIYPSRNKRKINTMIILGSLFLDQNKIKDAAPLLNEAYESCLEFYDESDPSTAEAENALGYYQAKMNNWEKAEKLIKHSYQILKHNYGKHDPIIKKADERLAYLKIHTDTESRLTVKE